MIYVCYYIHNIGEVKDDSMIKNSRESLRIVQSILNVFDSNEKSIVETLKTWRMHDLSKEIKFMQSHFEERDIYYNELKSVYL